MKKVYLLSKENVRKIVGTEAKRDALLALGYTVVPEPKKTRSKPPDNEANTEEPPKMTKADTAENRVFK